MDNSGIKYHVIASKDCEGLGWREAERENSFDRIPLGLKDLTQVFNTGVSTTGVCCHFNTNSTRFWVKMELLLPDVGEPNFNVCAFSGADLYMYDDVEQRWRWAATYTSHLCIRDQHPEYPMIEDIERKPRRCCLYLPMRNRLKSIAVGLDEDADFTIVPPRENDKLVYYGTSIIHGAYSTRSGLGIAQILARRLDMPLLNLGFSGACCMEYKMAEWLSRIDNVKALVVDAMQNMNAEMVRKNMPAFLDCVCQHLAKTQIFVVTSPRILQGWLKPALEVSQLELQCAMTEICAEKMQQFKNLHFIDGQGFYGTDEVSPDGIHPNDTGAWNMVAILYDKMATALK